MVHSKLIAEGRVEPLTFSQLRKLEKIDAKKEREAKLIEAGKEGIVALGRIGQGVMSNQVAGTILTVLGLYATYPAWIGTLQTATGAIVKSAADAWKNGILPGV